MASWNWWPASVAACLLAIHPAVARSETTFAKAVPVLDVRDPVLVTALEKRGFSLEAVLGVGAAPNLRDLYAGSPAYKTMADQIGKDVVALRQEMLQNGRVLHVVTDQNVGRILDLRWLQSPLASFRLVGVVNRLDRKDFADLSGEQGCGEVRFIYRMAYQFKRANMTYGSRMPFNLNVVYRVNRGSDAACGDAARVWIPAADVTGPERQAEWLTTGPLDRKRMSLKQIEINAQVVRFPSGMETEFGGQAVYLLRIFAAEGATSGLRLREKPLENTPDVARLKQDNELRKKLAAYLTGNVAAIDQGVFQIPDEFLATKVFSFSTYGSARLANHPFTELLSEQELANIPFAGLKLMRSPKALLERLDTATCMGCHQSNATAGFHFIGYDQPEASSFNRVKIAVSPHFYAEGFRRKAYVEAVAAGTEPNRFRPLPAAPPATWTRSAAMAPQAPAPQPAGLGMPCVPEAAKANFATTWSCAAPATCQVIATNNRLGIDMGQCLPREERQVFSGLPCLSGEIRTAAAPYRDTFLIKAQLHSLRKVADFEGYNCRPPKIGVPGGLSYRKCTEADKRFELFRGATAAPSGAKAPPNEICGLAGGKAFDECVASNNFAKCYSASVVRGNRPTCGENRFCREDFMCQALPDDIPGSADVVKDYGFCSPTYFLFQMRMDNHPDPIRGVP
jgi:hypothetical protein